VPKSFRPISRVQLDLNAASFQHDWFTMEREDAQAVLQTLRKIRALDWNQLYSDRGLRWERVESRLGSETQPLYSLRVSRKARAVGYRDGNVLRIVSLHPDHDSAYKK
jgi:hypothetical protein